MQQPGSEPSECYRIRDGAQREGAGQRSGVESSMDVENAPPNRPPGLARGFECAGLEAGLNVVNVSVVENYHLLPRVEDVVVLDEGARALLLPRQPTLEVDEEEH